MVSAMHDFCSMASAAMIMSLKAFQQAIGAENYATSRFQQLELLRGAADEK